METTKISGCVVNIFHESKCGASGSDIFFFFYIDSIPSHPNHAL